MWQPNIDRKKVSFVHVWVSIVLIFVTIMMSFSPMITLKTGDNIDAINEIISKIDETADLVIPEEVEVSMPKLLGSVKVITQMVNLTKDAVKNTESVEDLNETGSKLGDLLKTKEGKDTIILTAAFVATITGVFSGDEAGEDSEAVNDTGIIGTILNLFFVVIAMIYVLMFTFILPFIYILKGLFALIRALSNVKTPELVSGKVGAVLPSLLALPMFYLVFQSFIPGMTFASGSVMIWVLGLISVLCGAATARLRKYTDNDYKYSLILQGTSLLGIVGFAIYFFNILKTFLLQNFLGGSWGAVTAGSIIYLELNEGAEISKAYITEAIMILVAVFAIIGSIGYFTKCAGRVTCSVKKTRFRGISDFALLSVIGISLSYVLPVIVMGGEHDYSKLSIIIENADKVCFLELPKAASAALSASLVGIIIMFIAEIGLIVLKKVFCKEMSKEDMVAVMSGNAKTPDEKLAEAEKIIADAEAKAQAEIAAAKELVDDNSAE